MKTRTLASYTLLSVLIFAPAALYGKKAATQTVSAPKVKKQKVKKPSRREIGMQLARSLSGPALRSTRNVLDKKFFSSALELSDKAREVALATQEVAFVKLAAATVTTCRFNYMTGLITLTKFNKEGDNLLPVKTERFVHFIDGPTKCVQKGVKGRSAVPLAEGCARAMGATAHPNNMNIVSPIDLYNGVVPTWFIADKVDYVADWLACLQADQDREGIAPHMRDELLKPVCVVTVKNDLFLDSMSPDIWSDLNRSYQVTTFMDPAMRKHFWTTKDKLVEMRVVASNGVDLNTNLMQGIFADIAKASGGFSHKNIIRNTFQEISKKVFAWGIPAILVIVLYSAILNPIAESSGLKNWWNETVWKTSYKKWQNKKQIDTWDGNGNTAAAEGDWRNVTADQYYCQAPAE